MVEKPRGVEEYGFQGHTPSVTFNFETECGNWGENYARMHAAILKGQQENSVVPRYAVSVAVDAGTADRVAGIITGFLYALLSGRAFQILTYGSLPSFAVSMRSPYINWTAPEYDNILYEHLKFTYQGVRGNPVLRVMPAEVNSSLYGSFYWVNAQQGDMEKTILFSNLTSFPAEHLTHVFYSSNRGVSFRLFNNPYHRRKLLDMGLRPETAFRCVFNYLFHPRSNVEALMAPLRAEIHQPGTLVIGIQIRLGDRSFSEGPVGPVDQYDPYFHCARDIQLSRAVPGQRVVWYLITDSMQLRHHAKLKFGTLLITDLENEATHSALSCVETGNEASESCIDKKGNNPLDTAFADMLLFSEADFHVITKNSGFGQQGAWMHRHTARHIYVVDGQPRKCGIWDADPLEDVASNWSGL
ncbi:hypothetical protein HDU88_002315 [Geranomyces variabilis]|nr:hypothetical protein HDU88_002315 [Geranomyces variabilis]